MNVLVFLSINAYANDYDQYELGRGLVRINSLENACSRGVLGLSSFVDGSFRR